MTRSPTDLKPVRTGRYRYSKWRWRILVRAFDAAGGLAAPVWRWFRPSRIESSPRRILIIQLDHLGDAVLTSPLISQLRTAYPEAKIDVLASPSNHEVFESNPNIDRVRIAERTWFERMLRSRAFSAKSGGWDGRCGVSATTWASMSEATCCRSGARFGRRLPSCGICDGGRRIPADRRRRVDGWPSRGPFSPGLAGPLGDRA